MTKWISIAILFLYAQTGYAQTCCSGGVPISSNLGFQSSDGGVLQIAVAHEANFLNTLYAESTVLPLNNRQRKTQSSLLRLAYNISHRWGVETLLPYVVQTRDITQNSGAINSERSSGIGDIVLLLKYDIIKNVTWNLNLGIGPKFSTGSSEERNSLGLLLVNDLQPGSGATDFIVRAALTHNLLSRPSTSVFAQAIWTSRGTDPDYLGTQTYGFGSEIQLSSGISDQLITPAGVFYPAVSLRYRQAERDAINDNSQENTGGSWLFLRGSLGYDLWKNGRIAFSYERPIITQVDGTQLSPDHILNVSFYTDFSFSAKPDIISLNP